MLVNQYQSAGNHSVSFDASSLASGMYFYKLEAGSFQSIKKMMLLK
ncbi:MAG: T9SS type A sorting domain-containing protein [Ignavibacteria bacterium]|nr:T9SS type A sorting domain-containing protein [Ignavibacteria bacterium]